MFLAPRLLVRPSKKRTWNLLHLHAHLCWPFPVNLTVGTMISSSLSLLSKPASHQDDLCPQGGGGILAWRVCAGPTQLSCLTSGVPTSFGALGLVVSLISGDLLKLHFANKCESRGHLQYTALTLSVCCTAEPWNLDLASVGSHR